MVAGSGTQPRVRAVVTPLGREAVDSLAGWLLFAVALDLVVTRFIVRLAIFVPRGEPHAALGAVIGRIGAATDVLVPIVGFLVLGALLVRAGATGGVIERAMLVAVSVVAIGGLALVVHPPTPTLVVALGVLTGFVAVLAAIRVGLGSGPPVGARLGLAVLSLAVAAAAVSRTLDTLGYATGVGAWPDSVDGPALGLVGQVAFVVGAALVGLAGLDVAMRTGGIRRPWAAAGVVAGLVVFVAGVTAPMTWGALWIWSLGLTGTVPLPAVAIAVGLVVAGLPTLHGRAPSTAIGAAIVLFAGYGLAASGLVLAGLLGLVVAALADGGPLRAHPRATG